jgi:tetratricopeptide (TPR) repeat protein
MRRMQRSIPGLTLAALVAGGVLVTAGGVSAQISDPYRAHVRTGMSSFVVGDVASARHHFREALALAPSRPDALCYTAELNRGTGDLSAALDGFQDCLRFAREGNDRRFVARALHGIASTLERMPERTADARNAWQEYVRFADGASDVADARVGRARLEVIDAWTALEQRMVEVRARIAERERTAR